MMFSSRVREVVLFEDSDMSDPGDAGAEEDIASWRNDDEEDEKLKLDVVEKLMG